MLRLPYILKILPKILIILGQKFQARSSCTWILFEVANCGYFLCKSILKRDRTFSAKPDFPTNSWNSVNTSEWSKSYKMYIWQISKVYRLNIQQHTYICVYIHISGSKTHLRVGFTQKID